jgi:hypothetical protein
MKVRRKRTLVFGVLEIPAYGFVPVVVGRTSCQRQPAKTWQLNELRGPREDPFASILLSWWLAIALYVTQNSFKWLWAHP